MDGYTVMRISVETCKGSHSGGFEFQDGLEYRADAYRESHPEHQAKLEGNGLIVFPGEAPYLPGVY
jgi:hypothetical protein